MTLALVLALSVTAIVGGCGSGATPDGRYVFVSMETNGDTVDAKALAEQGMDVSVISLVFSGSKVSMVAFGETIEADFVAEGNHITIHTEDGPLKGKIEGNRITLAFGEGDVLVVEKHE